MSPNSVSPSIKSEEVAGSLANFSRSSATPGMAAMVGSSPESSLNPMTELIGVIISLRMVTRSILPVSIFHGARARSGPPRVGRLRYGFS